MSRWQAEAVAAAVRVAGQHGIVSTDPVVLKDRANLLVHLAPAPVVARIPGLVRRMRAEPQRWLEREVAVTAHAAAHGGPVLAPTDLLPAGPHEARGYWMTFSALIPAPPADAVAPDAAALSASLAALHASLADFPGELPYLVPVLQDVPAQVALHTEVGDAAVADAWSARLNVLEPALLALGPGQAVHGDAHAGNVVLVGDDLVWIDLEDTCRAPVGWDLACLAWSGSGLAVDEEALAPLFAARELQAEAWSATLALTER